MAGVKSIQLNVEAAEDLAFISMADDSVWLVVSFKWYDLATLAWWLLTPSTKRASILLTLHGGEQVRARCVRIARRHARVRGFK
jgi:hypothetical protein